MNLWKEKLLSHGKPDKPSSYLKQSLSFYNRKAKGNDFYKSKNYKEAIEAYSKAIALDPSNALLYTNRAAAALMTLQYKEAVQDSDQAIALDPNCAKAFFRKATALKGLGNLQGAIDALTAGLVADPGNSVALQDKTVLLNSQAKITQAKELLERRLYSQTLTLIDQITKDIGNAHREVNAMKVKALLALKRNEEALNLTNAMVRSPFPSGSVCDISIRSRSSYRSPFPSELLSSS